MKFLASQVAYFMTEREARGNLRALLAYIAFLAALVLTYTALFHLIKTTVEHEQHSWVTGLYWTLVVMSTLGFGDITFTSDVGRLFSVAVLLSGVVFLLVLLPFLFIRLFYAPWLEARVRLRVPRDVPRDVSGHVVIIERDAIANGLVIRLEEEGIPYVIVEPDPDRAALAYDERLSVVVGEPDSRATLERLGIDRARLVLANAEDTVNTNVTLTAREVSSTVPVVAIVEDDDSVDVLELSGATKALPLKHQLGQYLANRVHAGRAEAHVIGKIHNLQLAEVPARDTPFVGITVAETRLREQTGLSLLGLWSRGKLQPSYPNTRIETDAVLVLAGSDEQVEALNSRIGDRATSEGPVLVIGAGTVGQAAARAIRAKGLLVHAIDRSAAALAPMAADVDATFVGDANDRELLARAGIHESPSLLLTTNDDAMNIYLAVYCRRLNPDLRIISRITHERNVEAIHRAGADFALSYTTLGAEAVVSLLRGHEPVLLGEGVELFSIAVPPSLGDVALRDSGIGSRTGMSVVGIEDGAGVVSRLTAATVLRRGTSLVMLGSRGQRRAFAEAYEGRRPA
ncbi:MAG: NAD-binding protein [Acidobacteria bacterium]|nr:NAD-binding protein [Acidobacteriota bacterium]